MNFCVIPARGGSKRIPKKNIKSFCGKPLIAYSIDVAKRSELFDKILVSTDDEEIADVSERCGAEILWRPKELAGDMTGSDEVFEHAIEVVNSKNEYAFACMIYATAPFLQVKYLQAGLEALQESGACFSFAATSFDFPIWRGVEIIDGRANVLFPEYISKRSQDLKEAYHDAGQFYWKRLSCKQKFDFNGSVPIIIPRYLAQDIDTLEDFKHAELLYRTFCETFEG